MGKRKRKSEADTSVAAESKPASGANGKKKSEADTSVVVADKRKKSEADTSVVAEAGPATEPARSVFLAGVGGQGILLAANILARAAGLAGYDVKTNELHGMAQRGGSVVAEIRFGKKVYSPIIPPHGAEVLASLEELEALRHANCLAPSGRAVVSNLRLVPTTVSSGLARYPEDLGARLARVFPNLTRVDVVAVAAAAGAGGASGGRIGNLAVLGAVSAFLDFPESLWREAIQACVKPAFLAINLRAFELGREIAGSTAPAAPAGGRSR